jgi:DNA-binding transcriptional ArsR family regulator
MAAIDEAAQMTSKRSRASKGVEVITAPEKARVLVDPMRREIVRLLSLHPMTESELAETLGLSDPSVNHHLKIIAGAGLIRVARREVEAHGIVQKFYETMAAIHLVDGKSMPLEIERYFMPVRLERALGVVSALSLTGKEPLQVSTRDVEDFAKALDSSIIEVAQRYPKRVSGDREEIIREIYRDALRHLVKKSSHLPDGIRGLLLSGSGHDRSRMRGSR